jgi:hypothetical protein
MSGRLVDSPAWTPRMPAALWEELDEDERLAVIENRLTEGDLHDLVHALDEEEQSE